MNIEQYGISSCCGYGLLEKGDYVKNRFTTSFSVVAKSKTTTDTLQGLNDGLSYSGRISLVNRDGYSIEQPIFVVFDSDMGKWREYFTGIEVETASPRSIYGYQYDVDNSDANEVYRQLTVETPNVCSATAFAERVSRYSDKEIRDMANQIQNLSEKAQNWSKELDKSIELAKETRSKKESGASGVETKLANNFGKYGSSVNDSERSQRIKQGCCTYCGGTFKGLFIKTCSKCGKQKDY